MAHDEPKFVDPGTGPIRRVVPWWMGHTAGDIPALHLLRYTPQRFDRSVAVAILRRSAVNG